MGGGGGGGHVSGVSLSGCGFFYLFRFFFFLVLVVGPWGVVLVTDYFVISSTLNLSTLLSSPKEQPFYVGLTGFVYGSGCVLGPIVGGALSDSAATWRWVSQPHSSCPREG